MLPLPTTFGDDKLAPAPANLPTSMAMALRRWWRKTNFTFGRCTKNGNSARRACDAAIESQRRFGFGDSPMNPNSVVFTSRIIRMQREKCGCEFPSIHRLSHRRCCHAHGRNESECNFEITLDTTPCARREGGSNDSASTRPATRFASERFF